MSAMFYDKLTGLPNRNLFHNRLSLAMGTARRAAHGFASFRDIDHFKLVTTRSVTGAADDLLPSAGAHRA